MQNDESEKSLKIAIILTSIFFIVEVIGGLISGSLSLLSDAGHMFRDIFALFITLSAINIAKKLPTGTKTFGYHRIEIFAALVNGMLLVGISAWIFWEAYIRFSVPKPVESTIMFVIAVIGLVVNLYVALKLHRSHGLNVRSAFLHVVTDAVSSTAVIFASVVISVTGAVTVDSILGAFIGVIVLYSAIGVVKESVRIKCRLKNKRLQENKLLTPINAD